MGAGTNYISRHIENLDNRVFSANELDEETAVIDTEEKFKRKLVECWIRGQKSCKWFLHRR